MKTMQLLFLLFAGNYGHCSNNNLVANNDIRITLHSVLDMPKELVNIITDYASIYKDEYDRLFASFSSNKSMLSEEQKKLQKMIYNDVKALRENLKKDGRGFENLLNEVINLEIEMLLNFYFKKNYYSVLVMLDDLIEKIKLDYMIPDLELFNDLSEFFIANRFKLNPDSDLYWILNERVNRFCLYLVIKDDQNLLYNALILSYKVMCYSSPTVFLGEHFKNLDGSKYGDLDDAFEKKILNIDFAWLKDLLKNKYGLI